MKTPMNVEDMVRSNAEMAVDQHGRDSDTIADYAINVRDTLAEWGLASPRLVGMSATHGAGAATRKALGAYYARVAELLSA